MQLPSALHARLVAGPGATDPLPVARDPSAGAAPFRFAARRVRFPRDHDFFEVRGGPGREGPSSWAGPTAVRRDLL